MNTHNQIREWNIEHEIGEHVWYEPDAGERKLVRTQSAAYELHGRAVARVPGFGPVLLSKLEPLRKVAA